MAQVQRMVEQAITLEGHRAMNLTRPYTDEAIGWHTAPRRDADARASRAHTATPDVFDLPNRDPAKGAITDERAYDRDRRRQPKENT